MAIDLKRLVGDPPSLPFPTLFVGVLVFPIHSLVARSGLELPVDEFSITNCRTV